MKWLLLIFTVLIILLAACQAAPALAEPEPEYLEYIGVVEEYEQEPPVPPSPPPRDPRPAHPLEDIYIEMLDALQHAFATGEFRTFVDTHPAPDDEWSFSGHGQILTEWPALLEGITAEMSYGNVMLNIPGTDTLRTLTVELYVTGGNSYLPSGEQTLELAFFRNWETHTNAAVHSMMLNTDGRQSGLWIRPEMRTFEEQMLQVGLSLAWGELPVERTILFLSAIADERRWVFTEEEIIEGARRHFDIEDLPPASEWENRYAVEQREDGRFVQRHTPSQLPPRRSVVILDAPSQGDLTVRAFVYADDFLLSIREVVDYNFLVLHDDDGTPYARLLSEQPVELD
ncbi:MAG: hypothetical protein FWE19_03870 [Oscillospiraceae bacterium]|nr:hypothetical protein [Oscillospiraceae bacterium]